MSEKRAFNSKGLSLIELVMSMLMLSIVMLGASTLESSVIRIQNGTLESSKMQNELSYAYSILNRDLGDSSAVMIDTLPNTTETSPVPFYQWRIRPYTGNNNGADDITYALDLRSGTQTFRRSQGGVTQDLITPGLVTFGPLQTPNASNIQRGMWISQDLKLLTLNLNVDFANQNFSATSKVPGFGKSFYIRTAQISDCRGDAC